MGESFTRVFRGLETFFSIVLQLEKATPRQNVLILVGLAAAIVSALSSFAGYYFFGINFYLSFCVFTAFLGVLAMVLYNTNLAGGLKAARTDQRQKRIAVAIQQMEANLESALATGTPPTDPLIIDFKEKIAKLLFQSSEETFNSVFGSPGTTADRRLPTPLIDEDYFELMNDEELEQHSRKITDLQEKRKEHNGKR